MFNIPQEADEVLDELGRPTGWKVSEETLHETALRHLHTRWRRYVHMYAWYTKCCHAYIEVQRVVHVLSDGVEMGEGRKVTSRGTSRERSPAVSAMPMTPAEIASQVDPLLAGVDLRGGAVSVMGARQQPVRFGSAALATVLQRLNEFGAANLLWFIVRMQRRWRRILARRSKEIRKGEQGLEEMAAALAKVAREAEGEELKNGPLAAELARARIARAFQASAIANGWTKDRPAIFGVISEVGVTKERAKTSTSKAFQRSRSRTASSLKMDLRRPPTHESRHSSPHDDERIWLNKSPTYLKKKRLVVVAPVTTDKGASTTTMSALLLMNVRQLPVPPQRLRPLLTVEEVIGVLDECQRLDTIARELAAAAASP